MVNNSSIKMALDTNIIIYLHKFNQEPEELRKAISLQDFYSIKYLDEIIKEDYLLGRDKRVYFSYPEIVGNEMIRGDIRKHDMSFLNYARKYEFVGFPEYKKQKDCSDFLFKLLLGKVPYYKEREGFNQPLFEREDYDDCRIMAQCGLNNLPLITLNKKHFMGLNGEVKQAIKERFEDCNAYLKSKFGSVCKDSQPMDIVEFLQNNFPEKIKLMEDDIENFKKPLDVILEKNDEVMCGKNLKLDNAMASSAVAKDTRRRRSFCSLMEVKSRI